LTLRGRPGNCVPNGNDVATGRGKACELCSEYDSDVATGRGEGMIVLDVATNIIHIF